MKISGYIYLLLSLCTVCTSSAQSDSAIRFDSSEWNFGEISENDGDVSYVFHFTNTSDSPIVIENVSTSCGCTTTDNTRQPIVPDSTGSITVKFNPRGFEGDFEKTIFVTTSSLGRRYRNTLKISGSVTPRPKNTEDIYPFYMAGGIRFDNATIAFGYVGQGTVKSMVVKYMNTSDKDVKISFQPWQVSGLLTIFASETICAGCSGQITLTYDLEKQTSAYGMRSDAYYLIAGGIKSQIPLYTAMIGTDDFSDVGLETAPKAVISTQFHDFGKISRREKPYTYKLRLTNDGYAPLHIRSVENTDTFKSNLKPGTVIKPSSSVDVEMSLYSNEYLPQDIFQSVIVICDDPLRPMREIKCAARITE